MTLLIIYLGKPQSGILFDENHRPVGVPPEEWLEHTRQIFLKPATNSPERLFSLYYPQAILDLLHGNVFRLEEITDETILPILNEYHKLQISLNSIFAHREWGDYAYERQFTLISND